MATQDPQEAVMQLISETSQKITASLPITMQFAYSNSLVQSKKLSPEIRELTIQVAQIELMFQRETNTLYNQMMQIYPKMVGSIGDTAKCDEYVAQVSILAERMEQLNQQLNAVHAIFNESMNNARQLAAKFGL